MFKRLLVVAALTFLMAGCGYRGALYLPEDAPDNAPAQPPIPDTSDSTEQ